MTELHPHALPPQLQFTDSAAKKAKCLIDEEGDPNLNLRVFVEGGGCAGMRYELTFDAVKPDDIVIEKKLTETTEAGAPTVVRLLIDPISVTYLNGAEIDYREDVNGAQFVVRNLKAKTTCGCGSSFSAE